jgi:hypothetical protein
MKVQHLCRGGRSRERAGDGADDDEHSEMPSHVLTT